MQREFGDGIIASADFVYTRGSDLASLVNLNQPLPNAAGNNALGPLPYPNFGFVEWRAQNAKSQLQGHRLRRRQALREAAMRSAWPTRSATRRTTRRSSSPRRAPTPFRRTPATSTPGTGRATTTCGIASPRTSCVNLPLGANLLGRDWVYSGDLRVAIGPAVHGEPEQQQRRPEHDRPAERHRRHQRPGDRRPVVQRGGVPGRCRPASSATSCGTG